MSPIIDRDIQTGDVSSDINAAIDSYNNSGVSEQTDSDGTRTILDISDSITTRFLSPPTASNITSANGLTAISDRWAPGFTFELISKLVNTVGLAPIDTGHDDNMSCFEATPPKLTVANELVSTTKLLPSITHSEAQVAVGGQKRPFSSNLLDKFSPLRVITCTTTPTVTNSLSVSTECNTNQTLSTSVGQIPLLEVSSDLNAPALYSDEHTQRSFSPNIHDCVGSTTLFRAHFTEAARVNLTTSVVPSDVLPLVNNIDASLLIRSSTNTSVSSPQVTPSSAFHKNHSPNSIFCTLSSPTSSSSLDHFANSSPDTLGFNQNVIVHHYGTSRTSVLQPNSDLQSSRSLRKSVYLASDSIPNDLRSPGLSGLSISAPNLNRPLPYNDCNVSTFCGSIHKSLLHDSISSHCSTFSLRTDSLNVIPVNLTIHPHESHPISLLRLRAPRAANRSVASPKSADLAVTRFPSYSTSLHMGQPSGIPSSVPERWLFSKRTKPRPLQHQMTNRSRPFEYGVSFPLGFPHSIANPNRTVVRPLCRTACGITNHLAKNHRLDSHPNGCVAMLSDQRACNLSTGWSTDLQAPLHVDTPTINSCSGDGGFSSPVTLGSGSVDSTSIAATATIISAGSSCSGTVIVPVTESNVRFGTANRCLVCADRATGRHYGAMTCEGCKGFFRRSVRRKTEYVCRGTLDCMVSKGSRPRCQSCRLRKCIEVGMLPESVHDDRPRSSSHMRKRTPSGSHSSLSPTSHIREPINSLTISAVPESMVSKSTYDNGCTIPVGVLSTVSARKPAIESPEVTSFSAAPSGIQQILNTLRVIRMAEQTVHERRLEQRECATRNLKIKQTNYDSMNFETDKSVIQAPTQTGLTEYQMPLLDLLYWANSVPFFFELSRSTRLLLMKSACLELLLFQLSYHITCNQSVSMDSTTTSLEESRGLNHSVICRQMVLQPEFHLLNVICANNKDVQNEPSLVEKASSCVESKQLENCFIPCNVGETSYDQRSPLFSLTAPPTENQDFVNYTLFELVQHVAQWMRSFCVDQIELGGLKLIILLNPDVVGLSVSDHEAIKLARDQVFASLEYHHHSVLFPVTTTTNYSQPYCRMLRLLLKLPVFHLLATRARQRIPEVGFKMILHHLETLLMSS